MHIYTAGRATARHYIFWMPTTTINKSTTGHYRNISNHHISRVCRHSFQNFRWPVHKSAVTFPPFGRRGKMSSRRDSKGTRSTTVGRNTTWTASQPIFPWPIELYSNIRNIGTAQVYSIAQNWADWYYSNVIKAFTAIIKRQFADCQILLVNTARALKFLKEYADRQVQLCKVLQVYHDVPD